LLIGDFDTLRLQKALLEIQKLSNREINSGELTKKEFQKKERKRPILGRYFFPKTH